VEAGEAKEVVAMATAITDANLLRMLARAERDEEVWADATRRCGSADNARRFGKATQAAERIRAEVARRVVAAAESMLDD
jgi:hypothetical protein